MDIRITVISDNKLHITCQVLKWCSSIQTTIITNGGLKTGLIIDSLFKLKHTSRKEQSCDSTAAFHMAGDTVTIRIPDMSGIRMVDLCPVFKWSGF